MFKKSILDRWVMSLMIYWDHPKLIGDDDDDDDDNDDVELLLRDHWQTIGV